MIRYLLLATLLAGTLAAQPPEAPTAILAHAPAEYGLVFQGGKGLTGGRDGFRFLLAGIHAGRVLTDPIGPGPLRGTFEYAVEVFPFWQSYTPIVARDKCVSLAIPAGAISCSGPYNVGGTYSGVSVTPIILRWNLTASRRIAPWVQGAGGVLWTNHKYPGFGGPPIVAGVTTSGSLGDVLNNNGPGSDASVWNFTPQFGVGAHYFTAPRRSIDLSANAIHISSASLGDRNPGVNATVQFSVGYSWWKR